METETPRTITVPVSAADPGVRETAETRNVWAIQAEWHISDRVCGLCDRERHLAHIVKVGSQWFLFDATQMNETEDGFLFRGSYSGKQAAMDAAEEVFCQSRVPDASN